MGRRALGSGKQLSRPPRAPRRRAELAPQHSFLLTRVNGLPMTDKALYGMFVNSARGRTGKATNPHLVRDMVVTHLR